MESMGYEIGDEHYEYVDEEELYFETTTQEIFYLRTEYALQLSKSSHFQIESQKLEIKKRRRLKIISYYDNYVFYDIPLKSEINDIPESVILRQFEQTLDHGVNEDYAAILILLRDEEYRRLRKEEDMEQDAIPFFLQQQSAWDDDDDDAFHHHHDHDQNHILHLQPLQEPGHSHNGDGESPEGGLRTDVLFKRFVHPPVPPPPPPKRVSHGRRKSIEHLRQSNLLYTVDADDEREEKEWMKALKLKKFQIRINERKHQKFLINKHELEGKIQEIKTKNETTRKLKLLQDLRLRVDQCTEHQMEYIRNVSSQINEMRETIRNLMSKYDGHSTKTIQNHSHLMIKDESKRKEGTQVI